MGSLIKEKIIIVIDLSEQGGDFLYLEINFVGKVQFVNPACVSKGTGSSCFPFSGSESRKREEGLAGVKGGGNVVEKKWFCQTFWHSSIKKTIGWKVKKLRWLEALSYTNGRVSSFSMGVNNRWKSKSDNKGSGRLRECVQPE